VVITHRCGGDVGTRTMAYRLLRCQHDTKTIAI
jgi:hypothetical protein